MVLFMEISDQPSLQILTKGKKVKEFTLSFPQFTTEENERWDKKISKDYFACGCGTGKVFLAFSAVSLVVYFIIQNNIKEIFTLKSIVFSILIVFACSMLGKGIGLFIAKKRLTKNLNLLVEELDTKTVKS